MYTDIKSLKFKIKKKHLPVSRASGALQREMELLCTKRRENESWVAKKKKPTRKGSAGPACT